MKKIVTIAIRHPEQPNLFLHGLRRDNHKWALAGGHAKSGEADEEAAQRELREETGLEGVKLDHMHQQQYGDCDVHLFSCPYPPNFKPDGKNDPDGEFVIFKFLDPTTHANLHIPAERNILSQFMTRTTKPPEPMEKAVPKIKVEPFVADPDVFNPRKHDFIVRATVKGKPVGMMAVTHTPNGLMPFNFEVNRLHRRKGVGTAMALHAQKISGKKITRSPDMTQDAVGWANSFIGPITKAEEQQMQQPDVTLSYPVTIGDRSVGDDGMPYFLLIKNFGPIQGTDMEGVQMLIDQHQLGTPIDPAKLMFIPHKLAGLGGEKHVIAVHGLPQRIDHLKASASSIGPQSSTDEPYIAVDESTYDRLTKLGSALTSGEIDIKIHPAELKSGGAVLRTY